MAYMRIFSGLPGVVTVETESLFWFASNKPAPGNIVLRAAWDDDSVEEHIDALFEQIGQHLDQIDWFVFPSDRPADLKQRLEARGMPGGRAGNWLWCDLNTLSESPVVSPRFRIEQVRDDQQMTEWLHATEAGFEGDESIFYDAYARHGYGPDAFSLHYIGYLDDQPVTSATLLDAGGTATIYDVSTPPAFRKQGFGSAITHALMREIRDRGYADTWIWASDMATKVYRQLGYIDADFGLREHTWRKPSASA